MVVVAATEDSCDGFDVNLDSYDDVEVLPSSTDADFVDIGVCVVFKTVHRLSTKGVELL